MIIIMRLGVRFMLAGFCLLGCDDGSDDFELSVFVERDGGFDVRDIAYDLRSIMAGVDVSGEIPLYFSGGSAPPAQIWQLTTVLPADDDYELALRANLAETTQCAGSTRFAVPPRQIGVLLDCRAEPRPPPPEALHDSGFYIVGRVTAGAPAITALAEPE